MNRIEVTDLTRPELDVYARLTERQLLHYYEPNGGIFIAESPYVIERALDAGCRPISFLMEHKHIETKAAVARTTILYRNFFIRINKLEVNLQSKCKATSSGE